MLRHFTAAMSLTLLFLLVLGPLLELQVDARGRHGRGGRGGRGFRHFRHGGFRRGPARMARGARFMNHYDNFGRWGGWGRVGGHRRWGRWGGWARPRHRFRHYGWGGWSQPYYGAGGGYQANTMSAADRRTIDEEAALWAAQSYSYAPATVSSYTWQSGHVKAPPLNEKKNQQPPEQVKIVTYESKFRLGPDADVLEDGQLAFHLTKRSFLLVSKDKTIVIDRESSMPTFSLKTDPTLLWHLSTELKRQSLGLQSSLEHKRSLKDAPGYASSPEKLKKLKSEIKGIKASVDLLKLARENLGEVGDEPPKAVPSPEKKAIEVFASLWMMPDGSLLIARCDDGTLAYMDGRGIYKDLKKTPLKISYPGQFELLVFDYLKHLVKDADKTIRNLGDDKDNTEWAIEKLEEELQSEVQAQTRLRKRLVRESGEKKPGTTRSKQDAGSENDERHLATLDESVRRLAQAVERSKFRLHAVDAQLLSMPAELSAAEKMMTTLMKK